MVEFNFLGTFDQVEPIEMILRTPAVCATVASSNAELLDVNYIPSRGHGGTTRYIRLERVPCSPGSKKERWKKAVGFGFQPPHFKTSCLTRNAEDFSPQQGGVVHVM